MTKPLTEATMIILKAIELLREKGWCQGAYKTCRGEYCLYGALTARAACLEAQLKAISLVQRKVEGPGECPCGCGQNGGIQAWNDRPGRTKEEVLTLLHKVLTEEMER